MYSDGVGMGCISMKFHLSISIVQLENMLYNINYSIFICMLLLVYTINRCSIKNSMPDTYELILMDTLQ